MLCFYYVNSMVFRWKFTILSRNEFSFEMDLFTFICLKRTNVTVKSSLSFPLQFGKVFFNEILQFIDFLCLSTSLREQTNVSKVLWFIMVSCLKSEILFQSKRFKNAHKFDLLNSMKLNKENISHENGHFNKIDKICFAYDPRNNVSHRSFEWKIFDKSGKYCYVIVREKKSKIFQVKCSWSMFDLDFDSTEQ